MAPSATPRVLFVTLSNIGDLVMTTPALVALHEAYPHARVDVVGDRRSSDFLRACPFVGEIYHRDKAEGWRGMLKLVARLRRTRYEAVVDLRTDWLPHLLRCRRFSTRRRAGATGPHSAEQHFQVVAPLLPAPRGIPDARAWTDESSRERARGWLAAAPGRRLAIAPGANWAGKCWPVGHFARFSSLVAHAFDSLVLVGGPADTAACATMAAASALPVVDLSARTTLLEAVAVLGGCDAFIGNDSGLGHVAAACAVPTMTVFGPGRPARYRPWGARAAICVEPGGDLSRLAPETVAAAFLEHLARLPAREAV